MKKFFTVTALLLIGTIAWHALQPMLLIHRIEPGMTRAQVVAILGVPPKPEQANFPPCDGAEHHWTGSCTTLQAAHAISFAVWRYGVDTLIVVGFDAGGKVVFRDTGDT